MPQKSKSKIKSDPVGGTAFNLPQNLSNPSKASSLVEVLRNNRKKVLIILGVIIGLLVLGFAVKFYLDLREAKNELQSIQNNPNAKAKEESQKIVEEVGKLVELPLGEEPTVATVTDPAKLSDQEFFANSQAGDKVLIYQESKRAILYRPDTKKVIEIAPLNIDTESVGDVARQSVNGDLD